MVDVVVISAVVVTVGAKKKDFSVPVPDQLLFLRGSDPKRRRRLESAEVMSLNVVVVEVVPKFVEVVFVKSL